MNAREEDMVNQQSDGKGGATRRRARTRYHRNSKPAPGVAAIINWVLAEKVMTSGGSSSGYTNLQAIVLQLMSKSATGERRATKVLMRYRRRDIELKEPSITVIGGLPD